MHSDKLQSEPRFECTKCGKCCQGFTSTYGVIVFENDVNRISERLNVSPGEFITRYCRKTIDLDIGDSAKAYVLGIAEGKCVFLGDDMRCSIYEVRPLQCERMPFRFFWTGKAGFPYECIDGVEIPTNWSSDFWDQELINSLKQKDTSRV